MNKKKNAVVLVIDALSKKVLDDYPFPDELFIKRLEKRSISFQNMFTQGPFTEAALNPLLAGCNSLDNGSYLYGFRKCQSNIFKEFQKNKYSCLAFYSDDFSDDIMVEGNYYPNLKSITYSRLREIRKELLDGECLSRHKMIMTRALIQYNACRGISFYKKYIDSLKNFKKGCWNIPHVHYISLDEANTRLNENKDLLRMADDDSFLIKVVKDNLKDYFVAPQLSIPNINKDKIDFIYNQYFHLLINEQRKHEPRKGKMRAVFRNIFSVIKRPSKERISVLMLSIKNLFSKPISRLIQNEYQKYFSSNCIKEKRSLSLKRIVDSIIDSDIFDHNFFIYTQPSTYHPTSLFWTYDLYDCDLLESELAEAYELAKRIPKNIKGNIFTFLSIKYIDKQIQRLYNFLEEKELFDNTVFALTSDHGSWNYYNCFFHDVNGPLFEERLRTPCIIYTRNVKHEIVEKPFTNDVFPNTILSLCGLNQCDFFSESYEKRKEKRFLISENFSYGAPILDKPICYTIYDLRFKLVVSVPINEKPSLKHCVVLFDLLKDRYELKNFLFKKKYLKLISKMLDAVSERHMTVSKTMPFKYYEPSEHHKEIIEKYKKMLKDNI